MRLKSIHIENYRALESLSLNFSPMTVIIGENDVGKTSCMLAIRTLFQAKSLDNDADFFMRDRDRTVKLKAIFECPDPTDDQREFVSDGKLQIRCSYPYGSPRTIEIVRLIPQDDRFKGIDSQAVGDLRQTMVDIGILDSGAKPPKPEAQEMLKQWVAENVTDWVDEWEVVKETQFGRLLPDFVLAGC